MIGVKIEKNDEVYIVEKNTENGDDDINYVQTWGSYDNESYLPTQQNQEA